MVYPKESSLLRNSLIALRSGLQPKLSLKIFSIALGTALGTALGAGSQFVPQLGNSTADLAADLAGDHTVAKVLSDLLIAQPAGATPPTAPQTLWQSKEIRGIYLSRFQVTGDASEQTIRDRVRYYKAQGINTIIHGVWGNGCPMYKSKVMQEKFEMESCPNAFQEDWLDWMIDEAHKQDMQVHAYFEKGIKLDRNSPIFQKAVDNGWFVPGIDHTYSNVDHYLLDVDNPEVNDFFGQISAEFVQRYPDIDAVQWDDYLGYHADLPGGIDRTASLTRFVQRMRASVKQANPGVSFDLCHHNPYWSGRYFAADWTNWNPDRAFIQAYNDGNFADEIAIAEQYAGIAITENQLYHLDELVRNNKIKSILIFPSNGNPERAAGMIRQHTTVR
jgi:uncharacterized lipoprotein YddW (UPF0748 family)